MIIIIKIGEKVRINAIVKSLVPARVLLRNVQNALPARGDLPGSAARSRRTLADGAEAAGQEME